jgi:hypothetical protein
MKFSQQQQQLHTKEQIQLIWDNQAKALADENPDIEIEDGK